MMTQITYELPSANTWTVSGQNRIGRELTLLAMIQLTVIKQNAVTNNWLYELHLAVMLQSW